MPRFAILRALDPGTTREDIDAAAVQTLFHGNVLTGDMDPNYQLFQGVEWIRTYWQPGSSWATCLYTARAPEALASYEHLCGHDYERIAEITEFSSGRFVDPETGKTCGNGHVAAFALEATLPRDTVVDEPLFDNIAHLLTVACEPMIEAPTEGIHWIRAYWSEGNRGALALYTARDAQAIDAIAAAAGPAVAIRPVTEIYPDEYLER